MDLDHLEHLFATGARVLIHCNPYNPTGRVWSREELSELAELCERYDVLVFSDEIHQDLVYSDARHTPLAALTPAMARQVITFTAPTKAFNLAGLMVSLAVVPEGAMCLQYENTLKRLDIQVNQLGQLALCAAYETCDAWLDSLVRYLEENRDAAASCLQQADIPVTMIHPQGTYLYWLDLRATGKSADACMHTLVEKAGIAVYDGRIFGPEGEGFIRFNGACPREFMLQGLERLCMPFTRSSR